MGGERREARGRRAGWAGLGWAGLGWAGLGSGLGALGVYSSSFGMLTQLMGCPAYRRGGENIYVGVGI